jgi:hypothetical protein
MEEDATYTHTYVAFRQAREITSHEHLELRAFLRAKAGKRDQSSARAIAEKPSPAPKQKTVKRES